MEGQIRGLQEIDNPILCSPAIEAASHFLSWGRSKTPSRLENDKVSQAAVSFEMGAGKINVLNRFLHQIKV